MIILEGFLTVTFTDLYCGVGKVVGSLVINKWNHVGEAGGKTADDRNVINRYT